MNLHILKRIIIRFIEFGGWRVVIEYIRMGLLFTCVKSVFMSIVKRKSLKSAYYAIISRMESVLTDRYWHSENSTSKPVVCNLEDEQRKILWFCWLQGLDNAPLSVKKCIDVAAREMPQYTLRVITADNYKRWVELPVYIEEKYKKGYIPKAHMSDLLRVELLSAYGGIYMDASVYCSGFGNDKLKERLAKITSCDMFFFRYFDRNGTCVGIANWFIVAKAGNPLLMDVRRMMHAYWRDYSCVVNYYMMHLFMELACKSFSEIADKMPKLNAYHRLRLGYMLEKGFDPRKWETLKENVALHKLNHRKVQSLSLPEDGYN